MFSINTINTTDRYLQRDLSGNILIQIKSPSITAMHKVLLFKISELFSE